MLWWILKRSALRSCTGWYVNVILSTFAIKLHSDILMAALSYLTKSTFFDQRNWYLITWVLLWGKKFSFEQLCHLYICMRCFDLIPNLYVHTCSFYMLFVKSFVYWYIIKIVTVNMNLIINKSLRDPFSLEF